MLLAHPTRRVGREVGLEDGGAAGLTGPVDALTQALQGAVDIVQGPGRLGQLGFVPLFHSGQGTAVGLALRNVAA